jgi:FAD/FMN-containing dehydrogenase
MTFDIARLKALLGNIKTEDNPAIVKQKSRDFFWYSPVLKRQLDAVTGDLLVTPQDEAELIRVLEVCFAENIPVTPRGSGTGNYGQAMPLRGGVVLSLSELNGIGTIAPGHVVAGAGAILADIDRATRAAERQEIRMFPSTYATASIGGFVAGGSGGVGSITWGGLRDLGNVIRLRVVTMESSPRILELSGEDLPKVAHAYGTNGIITEVEVPLTEAQDWVEVIVGFSSFSAAASYGNALGEQDGISKKLISAVAAPVPYDYFLRHRKFLARESSVALLMIAPAAMDAFTTFTRRHRDADILFRSDRLSDEDRRGLPPIWELSWNHTTLRALRVDPTITYLQVLYPFPDQLEKLRRLDQKFGDEVPAHVEFARVDGKVTCFGLPLVRFSTEERLDEIIRIHEDLGCPIFNPHRYTLEEGGMKRTDAVQLAFKRQADPKGLLNPGKMLGWEDPDYGTGEERTYLFPAAG